jgi:hypothetical protein
MLTVETPIAEKEVKVDDVVGEAVVPPQSPLPASPGVAQVRPSNNSSDTYR